MNCARTKRVLAGFLDGALSTAERQRVHQHVTACPDCRRELDSYARLSSTVSRIERPAPPPGLVTRIRLQIARAQHAEPWYARAWSRVSLTARNFWAPVALPTTGGLIGAMLMFTFVAHSTMIGLPLGAVANDVPTNLIHPAEVIYLAPFTLSPSDDNGRAFEDDVIVETVVDAQGQAVSYEILAGPKNLATRRQLDQVVFFSRFKPQISFGRAESGGRVLLSFREIRVKG